VPPLSREHFCQEPIQYKCGVAQFCNLPFYVNRHTLIPRPDTEYLVEAVLAHAPKNAHIVDLCTGSGCIAITLALHGFNVTAVDISRKALRVAKKNAKLHNAKVKFVRADILQGGLGGERPEIIVSNPPYIRTTEIGKHDPSTLYEPKIALDGGADGLTFYRAICAMGGGVAFKSCVSAQVSPLANRSADANLLKATPPTIAQIYFESDPEQFADIKNLLQNAGFRDIITYRDRIIWAKK